MTYPSRDPDAFFELARDRLSRQLDTLDAVDNKLALLFSTSNALLGILAAVLALKSSAFGLAEYMLLGASVALYVGISTFSLRAYWCRAWNTGPNLTQVYRAYSESGDDREQKWEIANHLRLDYERNQTAAARKLFALQAVLPGIVTQTLVLAATLVLVAAD